MFAAVGYAGASTRAIARRAAVSLPALQYYFGGKAGLHRACAEYITADVFARLAPVTSQARQRLSNPALSRRELTEMLRAVLEPFLEGMAAERPASWVLFFTRAQIERSPAIDALFERVAGGILGLTAQIVARILQQPADRPEVLIRALSIVGQAAMVRRGRPMLLRALGWADFDGRRLKMLKDVLWGQVEASLRSC
jgi:TetR/AcrR family transcriptional regulator, regulator of cefoperazone and chloramphenicol sensitivity